MSWLSRADIVIHFEELIKDPIGCVERLRSLMDLPEPNLAALPTFESQRNAQHKYGNVKAIQGHSEKFFRSGSVGGWKDEMPDAIHALFWDLHGYAMEELGYNFDGSINLEVVKRQPFLKTVVDGSHADEPVSDTEPRPVLPAIKLDRVELISIHLPKTGGTSFEAALASVYGKDHITRIDIKTGGVIKADNQLLQDWTPNPECRVIHGHLLVEYLGAVRERFGLERGIPLITWLRHPASRVISNFYYLEKQLRSALKDSGLEVSLVRMQKSLEEFARHPLNRNKMHRFLRGAELEDFSFVGIMEHYHDDLLYLSELMGWKDVEEQHVNETTYDLERIDPAVIQVIQEMNELDYSLYQRACELREARMKVA
jgi:hypothetical protein